ncbi:tubulin polyglutamylase complex subunit 1-like isoform X2 [Dendronephthya gigantea]|uniref:tubulin polyglutamylase complex subunit 1-like isoform X2 n=1 Tax=Dendronephthya gigantea TaxID=151771 RepID=UPI001069DE34|nr:tubulin polyglutamylase complex subunit 1-like isoform X2 [Dendronephthya gigantea]
MADKKSSKQDELTSSRSEKSESPGDFLARVGVTRQMQEVLSIILENRPDDPVAYIAEYFSNVAEHVSSVTQAYQYLCLSHHTKPSYENNLLKAYTVLNRQKCGQGLKGLIGKSYNELLAVLCRDISSNESDTLLQLLQKRTHELVRFNDFSSGVTCCFLLKDFISEAKSLFQELDLSGKGHADYTLCITMLSQLTTSVSRTKETSGLSILEAGVSLSAQNVDIAMKRALADSFSQNTGKTMSLDEFVHQAGKIFFSKLPMSKNQ